MDPSLIKSRRKVEGLSCLVFFRHCGRRGAKDLLKYVFSTVKFSFLCTLLLWVRMYIDGGSLTMFFYTLVSAFVKEKCFFVALSLLLSWLYLYITCILWCTLRYFFE